MMWLTMDRFFNNKIKMMLLILIWTLIWPRGGCTDMHDELGESTASEIYDGSNNDGGSKTSGLKMEQQQPEKGEEGEALSDQLSVMNATLSKLSGKLPNDNIDKINRIESNGNAMQALMMTTTVDENSDGEETTATESDMNVSIAGNDQYEDDDGDGDDSAPSPAEETKERQNMMGDDEEDITALLQQQLIYKFAIKYRQIARLTLLTCRKAVGNEHLNQRGEDEVNDNKRAKQTPVNIKTMELLKLMYHTPNAAESTRTRGGQRGEATAKSSSPSASISLASGKGIENDNAAGGGGGGGGVGRAGAVVADNVPVAVVDKRTQMPLPRGILIKVVQIDQLINKRKANNKNNSNGRNNGNMQRSSSSFGSYGRSSGGASGGWGSAAAAAGGGGGAGRNSYTNANWLEHVLRSDDLRQIVVLDLSCGAASRRLLEMASNKALFNSTYHWLLIEDYAFNRQTGIDDDDSGSSNNNSNKHNDEVVNNSWNTNSNLNSNEQAKKQDIVGASTSVGSTPAADSSRTKPSLDNSKNAVGKRQQQQQQQHLTNDDAATGDEEDMEIIEKFLEKINININTELILAKRVHLVDGEAGAGASDNANKTLQKKDYYKLYDVWQMYLNRHTIYRIRPHSTTIDNFRNPGLQYGGQLNISEIGNFTLADGFEIAPWYQRSTTITRRMDMKLARIRCLVVVTNTNRTDTLEHYLTTHYDTHLDSMNRFNFALLSLVRDLYNFSFVVAKTPTWGYLKNGKFDGMIGALVRKQADIGGSPIFFRTERAKVIDYTARTWVARPCFIFRHPRSTKKDRIVFLQPFSNDVWIFLAFCGLITILLLWLLTMLERNLKRHGLSKGLRNEKVATNTGPRHGRAGAVCRLQARHINNNNGGGLATIADDEDAAASAVASTLVVGRQRIAAGVQPEQTVVSLNATTAGRAAVVEGDGVAADGGGGIVVAGTGFKRRFVLWGNIFCGQYGDDASQRRVGLLLESLVFYIGSICQQGLAFSTSFFSGRCIVITSLLFSFSIYQFYSASIVGTLLMEKPKTIRTLRHLIHSGLDIGIEDIAYNRDYFLRTKDPDAIELYAKKVTSVLTNSDQGYLSTDNVPPEPVTEPSAAAKAKSYREILHSHETGAHAKTSEASNWYDPEYGVTKIKKGRFAFHVDVATAYKIISDTFTENEICDLTEIQLFPPQKMVAIVQKGSPLRKMVTYGLRRVTEVGLMDYQRKVWHSPKPRCVKQIHTDDLRVDMQTFTSALLVLIFGYAVSLLTLGLEIMHHKLWQRYAAAT